tara:strand:+ start:8 stop:445 length:438 start_codon:yes stop_codon:yes gene_type:complete
VEEPFRTVIAGMIGGALMGMIFVTHLALLLVYSPPKVLRERAVESNVSNLITMTALVTFLGWNLLAVAMSFAAQALFSNNSPSISLAPAPVYVFVVVFVSVLIAIPALIIFRDRKRHLLGQLIAFVVVFGLLIPNLVVALQRAQI